MSVKLQNAANGQLPVGERVGHRAGSRGPGLSEGCAQLKKVRILRTFFSPNKGFLPFSSADPVESATSTEAMARSRRGQGDHVTPPIAQHVSETALGGWAIAFHLRLS